MNGIERIKIIKELDQLNLLGIVQGLGTKKGNANYRSYRNQKIKQLKELEDKKNLTVFERLKRKKEKKTKTVFDRLEYFKERR